MECVVEMGNHWALHDPLAEGGSEGTVEEHPQTAVSAADHLEGFQLLGELLEKAVAGPLVAVRVEAHFRQGESVPVLAV